MNAIELLKSDHKKVLGMLSELNETTERAEKTRVDLLQKIEKELSIHTTIEEEIFYPAYREAGKKEDVKLFHEATEEHRAVELTVLPDLKNTSPTTVEFSGRAKVLKELVEHHAKEEEDEMFVRARKLLTKDQLEALGTQMDERKKVLMKTFDV